jgi:hypothetical protein
MKSDNDESNASVRKKPYVVPKLITYGTTIELTQAAGVLNQSDGGQPVLTKTS